MMRKNLHYYLHASIWLAYGILLVLAINRNFSINDAIIKALVILTIHISLFYFNSNKLIPNLIRDKKTWLYFLYISVIFIVLLIFFNWFERQFIPDDIPEILRNRLERQKNNPFSLYNPKQLFRARLFAQLLAMLIILVISSAYSVTKLSRKKERNEELAISEKIQSEMKFLKSQINPHFLFNALNNIYSLTITGSKHSSDMILKLSEMLRYILYECNEAQVPLENEWKYIENYVEFQKLKSKDELNIRMEFNNAFSGALIAPMILIPFVENAFKHSRVEDADEGWVSISLNNNDEAIIFQVENSIPKQIHNKDDVGGIGMENVNRRLELAYGTSYDLIVNHTPTMYSAILRINKKQ
jgi:sensor histidine kinase YesM